jgi:hypothetical protein
MYTYDLADVSSDMAASPISCSCGRGSSSCSGLRTGIIYGARLRLGTNRTERDHLLIAYIEACFVRTAHAQLHQEQAKTNGHERTCESDGRLLRYKYKCCHCTGYMW